LDEKVVDFAREVGMRLIMLVSGLAPWSNLTRWGGGLALGGGKVRKVGFVEDEGRQKVIWDVIDQVGRGKFVSVLFGYMVSAHQLVRSEESTVDNIFQFPLQRIRALPP
jgi:hypothetical protein